MVILTSSSLYKSRSLFISARICSRTEKEQKWHESSFLVYNSRNPACILIEGSSPKLAEWRMSLRSYIHSRYETEPRHAMMMSRLPRRLISSSSVVTAMYPIQFAWVLHTLLNLEC